MAASALRKTLRAFPLAVFLYQRWRWWREYRRFLRDWREFSRRAGTSAADAAPRFDMRWEDRYVHLYDRLAATDFDPQYIYHVGWAIRLIARLKPAKHVDISSQVYFPVTLSAIVPVKYYEFRPAPLRFSDLESLAGDLHALPMATGSVPSLSCMHVIEHIGLGRYGDPIDPAGDLKAVAELIRVLAPGGTFLFVTPTGRPRICFNAHRVYSHRQVVEMFMPLVLKEFALLPDDPSGGLVQDAPVALADAQSYGCGCYRFEKP